MQYGDVATERSSEILFQEYWVFKTLAGQIAVGKSTGMYVSLFQVSMF